VYRVRELKPLLTDRSVANDHPALTHHASHFAFDKSTHGVIITAETDFVGVVLFNG
jgi:hypothetical protein